MKTTRTLFDSIPDTVVITDTYGYILDFNRQTPFDHLKKAKSSPRSYRIVLKATMANSVSRTGYTGDIPPSSITGRTIPDSRYACRI